ncbi:hypothetical protein VPH35_055998 [Triticum aestivum]
MMQHHHQLDQWLAGGGVGGVLRPTKSAHFSPVKTVAVYMLRTHSDSFHVAHKVPVGDTPYVRAKRVQDPEKAIALFWGAINAGDRVDSVLKDMSIMMKQQNRAGEAIEAIKLLRVRCSNQAQESLDKLQASLPPSLLDGSRNPRWPWHYPPISSPLVVKQSSLILFMLAQLPLILPICFLAFQMRQLKGEVDIFSRADGSALFEMGNTRI